MFTRLKVIDSYGMVLFRKSSLHFYLEELEKIFYICIEKTRNKCWVTGKGIYRSSQVSLC